MEVVNDDYETTKTDDRNNDINMSTTNDVSTEPDVAMQVRISFHLASEYKNVTPSIHVPNDIIAVPANINRKGLSTIINHLLDRYYHENDKEGNDADDEGIESNDENKLPAIPFEFIIGQSNQNNNNNKLFRNTHGGIEHEVRKLGLSLEEAIHVTYFPAQLPPEPITQDDENQLPDWISTMQSISITPSSSSSPSLLLCAGCYDGSIVVLDGTEHTDPIDSDSNDSIQLSSHTTKSNAHSGPIHCMSASSTKTNRDSTTSMDDMIYIVSGSIDQTLRIHPITQQSHENNSNEELKKSNKYEFRTTIDCINGHSATVSSVDTFMITTTTSTNDDLYIASGDWDGNVCIWKYDTTSIHESDLEQYDKEQPSAKKKTKRSNHDTSTNDTTTTTASTTITTTKNIRPINSFRAHSSKVSGISYGNYEKKHCSTIVPKQIITSSWDHSIKVWDIERYETIVTMNGLRVITCMDTSYDTSNIVVTGHPDCTIRLWDVRIVSSNNSNANTNSLKISDTTTFKPSHKEWISNVKWSYSDPYQIVSTSYDGTIKLWDIRSTVPLYTIPSFLEKSNSGETKATTNNAKGLCVCYGNTGTGSNNYLFAGGTDSVVKQYKLPSNLTR
jgi:ribosome biogenesis protein